MNEVEKIRELELIRVDLIYLKINFENMNKEQAEKKLALITEKLESTKKYIENIKDYKG